MSSLKSSPSGKFSLSSSLKSLFMGGSSKHEAIITAICSETRPPYLEQKYLDASMISGSLVKFVMLPACVSRTEWLASHIFDFGSMIIELWEAVLEAPTALALKRSKSEPNLQTFPCSYQKQEAMISWLQDQITTLPAVSGSTEAMYVGNFEQTIVKTSFGIFVDLLSFIYGNFFDRIIALKLESVLNSLFMHVVMFGKEFGLIGDLPLEDLYKALACRHLRHYSTSKPPAN